VLREKSGDHKSGFVSVFQKLYLLQVDLIFTGEEKGLDLDFLRGSLHDFHNRPYWSDSNSCVIDS